MGLADQPELLLERNTLVTRFGASDPSDPVLCHLHALVSRRGPFDDDGIGWLEDLVDWLGERTGRVASRQPGEEEFRARSRVLIEALEEIPSFRTALAAVVRQLVTSTSSTQLFTGTGLPTRPGFWGELLDRATMKVLPEPPVEGQLARICGRLFASPRVAHAFVALPNDLKSRLAKALEFDDGVIETGIVPGLREAALILSARLAAQGTADDLAVLLLDLNAPKPVTAPSAVPALVSSPFLRVVDEVRKFLDGASALPAVQAQLDKCRALVLVARQGLETRGISIDLVFRLELLEALLRRLGLVMTVLAGPTGGEPAAASTAIDQLFADLVVGTADDRSLSAVWGAGTRLLARRVVERAGTSGENYVTRTRVEQRAMLAAAAGGGAVTAFIVLTKFFAAHAGLAPLWGALAIGLNYAWGFVLMQWLHFSLATKQPSMTAATIAGAVEAGQTQGGVDLVPVVDLLARASRTQFTALLGNVVMVVPLAVLIDLVMWGVTGHHVLDAPLAQSVVKNHNPLTSSTLICAATTGVWLWAASLLAGGVENWFIVRELPGALASSRVLRRLVGPARALEISKHARAQVSGLGGNIGLGLLLGFMPMLFSLFGVPLEVRHVTFVTGQLAFAVMERGLNSLTEPAMLEALSSIPIVGLINFAVSFLLALVVALRARGLGLRWLLRLSAAVGRRFIRSPKEFFLAPKTE